ncbi:hypothetical protein ICN49_03395 [Polynucleobacter sp. MWH-Mekk-B1]|uniref:hypothetical protein n=1 Tax=Polynucleobacter finlandensis TaxID=1855894 RepID=UPI001C0DFA1A|nr:hypothetical protein [Polynucleobacter finlandensis]MBU3543958.1 hypothetical protein [Polynucleobacter finlandensis]
MAKPQLTILTDPLPWGNELLHEGARRIYRWLRTRLNLNKEYFRHNLYRGHVAVTRSLLEGLKHTDVKFNYNPTFPWDLANTVIVLAGVRTLRQAILLKRAGKIRKLYAGPNIVVFSSEHDSILAEREVDAAITPCNWVIDVYLEDNPSLKERIFSWPAGVDIDYWVPNPLVKRDSILIFEKQNKGPVGPIDPYVDYLRALGWKVQIIKYGSFTHNQYLAYLQESCLMLGFVVCESQGLAWAEAWSTDLPTLILKRTSNVLQGRLYKNSSAPYLCPENGLFFDDFEDFKKKFHYWESHRKQFTPREWVIKNMSDEVCATKILKNIDVFK